MFGFNQLKNNFSIVSEQPLGYLKGVVVQAPCSAVNEVSKLGAKAIIHTTRFGYDIAGDAAKGVANLSNSNENAQVNAPAAQVNAPAIVAGANQPNVNEAIGEPEVAANKAGWFSNAKAFVANSWNEKDSTYLGQVSNQLTEFSLAKSFVDVLCFAQALIASVIVGVVALANEISKAGMESAYVAGEAPIEHELLATNYDLVADYVPADSIESEFVNLHVNKPWELEGVEMAGMAGMMDLIG